MRYEIGRGVVCEVTVLGEWPGAVPVAETVSLAPAARRSVTIWLAAEQTRRVRLWHPHGDQALYNITVTFTPHTAMSTATAAGGQDVALAIAMTSRRIGFRHIALVTTNDSDPNAHASIAAEDGSGRHTMFLRVNGAPLYARGGNKVPMDLIEGRLTAAAHRRLVQSATEGNFNSACPPRSSRCLPTRLTS